MRRVLLISPHFPPDSTAGTHRVRLLAPYLQRYGWEPTVLTVESSAYEGVLDDELSTLLPAPVRVIRAPAFSTRVSRPLGIGDLGLRSFMGLKRKATELLRTEKFDALFITIFPAYTALLGPMLVRRFHIPFVLDYQDPWVSAWGSEVGGGPKGKVDLKSRASRALAKWLEPHAVRAASAITAVSAGTYEPILARNPTIRPITDAIPIGAEPLDFRRKSSTVGRTFDASDDLVHICYTGAMLPLGYETLRAVLRAAALLRDRQPKAFARLRFHFYGTSNQSTHTDELRVMPEAAALGLEKIVEEVPTRVPYSRAVRIQTDATVLLAMGSSERHYTASKIYPLLMAQRPLLAVYHEASTVVDALRRIARPPSVQLIAYNDVERAESRVAAISDALLALATDPTWHEDDIDASALAEFTAARLAARLADVFDRAAARRMAA
jgi:hypothetical protein